MTTAELFYGLFLPFLLVGGIVGWFVSPVPLEKPTERSGGKQNLP